MTYPEGLKIIRKKSIYSTNLFLKENFINYLDISPLIIIANEQTAGRGQGDHKWFSPRNTGIYISFLFKLSTGSDIGLLPMCTGNSIVESLNKKTNIKCSLKWPNDIEFKGKKLGGILTENSFLKENVISIIGIGLNVNNKINEFPQELSEKATSLSLICGKDFKTEPIIMEIATQLTDRISKIKNGKGREIAEEYKSFLKHKEGDLISFHHSGKSIRGYFAGINSSGGIILETGTGETKIFYSGEISTDIR